MARERRTYTVEFKKQIVELYNSGKPRAELIREYELTPSALASRLISIMQLAHLKLKIIEQKRKMS